MNQTTPAGPPETCFQLSDVHRMMQDMVRSFCEKEILPQIPALEKGEASIAPLMRKLATTFGISQMAEGALRKQVEKLREGGEDAPREPAIASGAGGMDMMMPFVLFKEISRVSPGFAMSFGVSVGLAGGAIQKKGTADQIERWGIPLATCEKVGSWCLTEPGAGSDAFGSMKSVARREGDRWLLNGQKTFITNGPIADIYVVYCRLDDPSQDWDEQPIGTFVLERGMKGFDVGKNMDKMGMKDSPTCELFFDNVELTDDHLLGGVRKSTRGSAKDSLGDERSGLPAMAWGIIERCYEIARDYSKERVQFGRPIAEYQAIQLKLAEMYIHLKNVENIVYRTAWMSKNGVRDFAFICASKAYCSRVSFEVANMAIQILGGYGYMEEYHVAKLARDAKLLEIGAGTTDINLLTAARLELGLA